MGKDIVNGKAFIKWVNNGADPWDEETPFDHPPVTLVGINQYLSHPAAAVF